MREIFSVDVSGLQRQYTMFFYTIVIAFTLAQLVKLFFLAPIPETGGDAAQKWFLARHLADDSMEFVRSLDAVNHHFLRWATWIPATILISVFGDSVTVYYLSTFLISLLAAIIFIGLFFRHFGTIAAILLSIVWYFDPQLDRALFQLLPTGASLLPLALLILAFQGHLDEKIGDRGLVLYSSIFLFWLYGAKETNIFFAPGVFVAVWILTDAKHAFGVVLACLALYISEAIALSWLFAEHLPGGRLLALLAPDAMHLNTMINSGRILNETDALWDAGIISRWYTVMRLHVPIYIPSITVFVAVVASFTYCPRRDQVTKLAYCISIFALSFVLLTSFFIVSIDPVRLGQPLRPRYIAILLPLSYFILTFGALQMAVGRVYGNWGRVALAAICVSFVVISLYFADFGKKFLREGYNTLRFTARYPVRMPLSETTQYFAVLGESIEDTDCELPTQEFKKLYFGLMYVSSDNNGRARFLDLDARCEQAASFRSLFDASAGR